ncbi:hypothetical protein GOP47_0002809 [Adiantum capillus-veneris]|uniref:Ubiquitin carboxyl-terminal hydrolase n=1 Tax=Adiantum capillus-veneris TaxID=13818 RepID=A0A9D4ZR96_ADICA|nr:hypothetical protein GOP47_0002809 [Adiantum capillus-veneris]
MHIRGPAHIQGLAQERTSSLDLSPPHLLLDSAASMASIFPHQMLFHHSTCKGVASLTPAVLPFSSIDCSPSQLDAEDVYGFIDESPPFPLQYTPVERIGAGLANLGNTCFLNSVLQCLTYTPPLAAHLQAGLHNMSCNIAGFCAMCALERHVREALSSYGRVVSPSYLVKNLRSISRSFQLWRQEDAHEYMRYLIEALQRCCSVELVSGGSFIKSVFGGRLRSQVKCTQCSYCSNKYDPFLDLSLEVARADSLHKALAHFTAIEVLDGDNKYHCSKCNTKVRALKQFTIDQAPPILTVQLKRFGSSGSYGGKIDKKVHFERELDLKPFVTGTEDEDLRYSLYAVLVHSGYTTHSGHYYCFVRTATDTWHAMDDSEVSQVSESSVLAQKAYILFYVRNSISGGNHFQENLVNLAMSPPHRMRDHNQDSSENLGTPDSRSTSLSSNCLNVSNEDGVLTVAEQALNCLKLHDDSRKSVSGELQEKPHSPAILETDERDCFPPAAEVTNSLSTVKETDADILNDFCEDSWYRAVQAINNTYVNINNSVVTEAEERLISDAQEKTCAREQSVCTDDETNGGDTATCSISNDDANSGLDNDEVSTPEWCCQQRRHSFFSVVSPILRTTRIETAGHHALSILCMSRKFVFKRRHGQCAGDYIAETYFHVPVGEVLVLLLVVQNHSKEIHKTLSSRSRMKVADLVEPK